jgi:hypothetical protein
VPFRREEWRALRQLILVRNDDQVPPCGEGEGSRPWGFFLCFVVEAVDHEFRKGNCRLENAMAKGVLLEKECLISAFSAVPLRRDQGREPLVHLAGGPNPLCGLDQATRGLPFMVHLNGFAIVALK